ncbi:hypothetical protein GCM10023189_46360 [Nibrella saemangeumensis]|uniref:DinB-like domain-containing protein n=1 Tax=Nibrella saemangeumensis TaxID=1084526 RepID=A0ABP8NDL9_9BACT
MTLLTDLTTTRDQTLACFDLPEADLARTYAPGKWTIRQILVHLADAESVLHERIRRIIAEPKQVIWAFDQDLWAAALAYELFPLNLSRDLFRANRNAIIYLADSFYEQLGSNEFVHSQTGLRTLKDEFDKVAWHNQNHLDQITRALSSEK